MTNPLDLLESLSIGSDYSPESLDKQSRNVAANQKRIDEYAAEIRQEREAEGQDNEHLAKD